MKEPIRIDDRTVVWPAETGWVVYDGDAAHYHDTKQDAEAHYNQLVSEGKEPCTPRPAHMGI